MTLPSTMKKNPKRMNMTNTENESKKDGVDVDALLLLAEKLDYGDANRRSIAEQIRKAVSASEVGE